MMFLLPYQYSWALVASYDVHDTSQHSQQRLSHFGHHEHQLDLGYTKTNADNESQPAGNQSNNHEHHGLFHLSCGEILNADFPIFEATSTQFLSQYALVYLDPSVNALERPKWLQPI